MRIFGAGLAGLLAGCHFPHATIIEAGPSTQAGHRAVLRFRSSVVGDSVGIEFRRVRVRKGIWSNDAYCAPNIRLANQYSLKVIGSLADRSIWDLEPVDRYIAPETFQAQLVERIGNRIHWGQAVTKEGLLELSLSGSVLLSTIPLSILAHWFSANAPTFQYAPIFVKRYRLKSADVFQTVYFPDPTTSLYRVSITGNLVIAEYSRVIDEFDFWPALGLPPSESSPIEISTQRFGKILPVEDAWRKAFIFSLSQKYNLYSLGRYGVWRNLLLDDVVQDISKIKKLIHTSPYSQQLASL